MDKRALTTEELTQFFKDMELGTEQTIMAIDGAEDDVMPDLAMGVIKEKYFDSNTTTFLAGVYGSDYELRSFFAGDYDDEDTCIKDLVEWLTNEGACSCNNFGGLYIKPTDEQEQSEYEENKYNGEVTRTIPDSFLWGDVDMVARFTDGKVFYDCYQREGRNYLGEFNPLPLTELDEYTDQQIIDTLENTKHDKVYNNDNKNPYNGVVVRTIDTLDWGDVDMVSRYDIDDGVTFYDCYQKDGGGYLGEFRLGEYDLDQYTDDEIESYLEDNMQTGW